MVLVPEKRNVKLEIKKTNATQNNIIYRFLFIKRLSTTNDEIDKKKSGLNVVIIINNDIIVKQNA